MLLGDDLGAQLLQAAAALLTAGLLAVWGKSRGSTAMGTLAAAFWLGTPMVVRLSGTATIDLGLTLFFTLALYGFDRWRGSGERAWLTIAAFAAGCAAASKYTGLFVAAGLVLLVLWNRREGGLRAAQWVALVAGLTLGPWYLRIWLHTGNPVYPLFESYFGASQHMGLFGSATTMLQAKGGLAKAMASWARLPWTLVAGTPYSAVVWSPVYLIGLPLAIWIGVRERWARPLGTALVVYTFVFALLSFPDVRLLLPIAPLWCLLIGAGCDRVAAWVVPSARVRVQVLAGLAVASLLPGLWWGAGELARLGRFPVGAEEREAFLRARLPAYPALSHLNQTRGERSSVYAVFAENLAYYARGRYQGGWFGPAAYQGVFPAMTDPDALADRLRELGADHLLLNGRPSQLQEDAAFARRFELVFANAGARLYRLRPSASSAAAKPDPSQTSAGVATSQDDLRAVTRWGPGSTRVMTPFNVQPDGASAFWVVGEGAAGVKLELGGTILPTYATETAVTATVSPDLLRTIAARPAKVPLYLVSPELGRRQQVGFFEILE